MEFGASTPEGEFPAGTQRMLRAAFVGKEAVVHLTRRLQVALRTWPAPPPVGEASSGFSVRCT